MSRLICIGCSIDGISPGLALLQLDMLWVCHMDIAKEYPITVIVIAIVGAV